MLINSFLQVAGNTYIKRCMRFVGNNIDKGRLF